MFSLITPVSFIAIAVTAIASLPSAEALRRGARACPSNWMPQGDQGNGCPRLCLNPATGEKLHLIVRYTVKGALLKGCTQCEERWIEDTDCVLIICPEDHPPCPETTPMSPEARPSLLGRGTPPVAVPMTLLRRVFGNGTAVKLPGRNYIRNFMPARLPSSRPSSEKISTKKPVATPTLSPPTLNYAQPSFKNSSANTKLQHTNTDSDISTERSINPTIPSQTDGSAVVTTPISPIKMHLSSPPPRPTSTTLSETELPSVEGEHTTTVASEVPAPLTEVAESTTKSQDIPLPAPPPKVQPQYRPGTRFQPE